MLKNLKVSNFKGWESLDVEFGSVTGLFGTNSSGKSSLLQFLLLLKHTKNATDRSIALNLGGPGKLVNLGTFTDVVHHHNVDLTIGYSLEWEIPKEVTILDLNKLKKEKLLSGKIISIESTVSCRTKGQAIDATFLKYSMGGHSFTLSPKTSDPKEFQLSAEAIDGKSYQFNRTQGRAWTLPGPKKTYLFPDQVKTYHTNAAFLNVFEVEYEEQMDQVYYLGPLRDYPQREYRWGGAAPVDVGLRGELTIEAIMSATEKGERRNARKGAKVRSFQEMIAYWLKKIGLISEFRIEEIGENTNLFRALVKRDPQSAEASLTDVGFGVSQVLPALVLLHYVPEGSTILMEQPEIHLHPSVQSGLADVILETMDSTGHCNI